MALTLNSYRLGSLFFHGGSGRISIVRNVGETFSRLGQTGSGAQITAARAGQSRIVRWRLFDTVANAQDFADSIEDLVYTVVQSDDPSNGTFDRLRITDADIDVRPGRTGSGTSTYGALLTATITVEPLI